jgi:glycosyltransferase involved in cell wall biosynthesis
LAPPGFIDKNAIQQHAGGFSHCIFVSQGSLNNSLKLFPFMRQQSIVVHNLINSEEIIRLAQADLLDDDRRLFDSKDPIVATVANIRPEKQHLRQLEAMVELKRQGVNFKWLNIGVLSDVEITSRLQAQIKENGLEAEFLLLGPRANPYPLIKRCDAVTVLSDVESWSLVITEALSLGVPVVATPTSGALEQIENEKNGMLTEDFKVCSIVGALKRMLAETTDSRKLIKCGTSSLYDYERGVREFETLLKSGSPKRSILYVIDDANYVGGAHKATFRQAKMLMPHFRIAIFTNVTPNRNVEEELSGVQVVSQNMFKNSSYLLLSTKDVIKGNYSAREKLTRCIVYASKLLRINGLLTKTLMRKSHKEFDDFLEGFDNVISMSEISSFREIISRLKNPKKVQWIHQNYATWYGLNDWTRWITNDDANLYSKYDAIVTLSNVCRVGFIKVHPHLAYKTLAIRNISPDVSSGNPYVGKHCYVNKDFFNIITIARFDDQKNIYGLITIARLMRFAGVKFHWYIIGSGDIKASIDSVISLFDLNECIITPGNACNPYHILAQADVFVLFSLYEGTPVTIEEAQLLGVPVVARDADGIPDMIDNGETGVLVAGDEMSCFENIMDLYNDKEKYCRIKANLPVKANGDHILKQLIELLG